jgi:cytochrome c oxidase subunit 2
VRVVPAREFTSWLGRQRQAGGGGGGGGGAQAADGKAVFDSGGCGSCHTLADAGTTATVGPDLDDIANATKAYIRESIVDPNADVIQGYPRDVMPGNFADQLSPAQLDALVEYLLEAQR